MPRHQNGLDQGTDLQPVAYPYFFAEWDKNFSYFYLGDFCD